VVNSRVTPDKLFSDLIKEQQLTVDKVPPVHLWNPQKTGDIDIRIDREGRWLHGGKEIKRPAMVTFFSRLLKLEEGVFYLVTPVEKWQISVDIAPLYVIRASRERRHSMQAIVLSTSTDDAVVVDQSHPLTITNRDTEDLLPLVTIRDNLNALISRPVFYQLVEWGHTASLANGNRELLLESMGHQFSFGNYSL
jgi:hypothetical protein